MMTPPSAAGAETAPVFSEKHVLCHVECTDEKDLVGRMTQRLAGSDPLLDPAMAAEAVMEREAQAPAFLAPGVAMPHARITGLDRTLVAVATAAPGRAFAGFSGPGAPARLAVLVLAPAEAPAEYLKVAAAIARRLDEPGAIDKACALDDAEQIVEFFQPGGGSLHGHVRAADLMAPPPAILKETDSVKDAIDLIVRTGLSSIPVVDKEGDLVGVASADDVLRVCIPDYLLWMEDLSPFSNFEPFATLMAKEGSTWIADITDDDDFASAQVDEPAIRVAEAMARYKTGTCYVLEGAKLIGVVTLPSFLKMVFRD